MVLRMAGAMERGRTFYFRERVPADLVRRLKGRKVFFPVDGQLRPVTLGEFAQVSLRTREPKVAKERHRDTAAAVTDLWQRFRQDAATGPVSLTGRQVEALSGQHYRALVAEHGDNPGDPDGWDCAADAAEDFNEKDCERAHGEDADRLLHMAGLVIDGDSRARLLGAMNRAAMQAARCLERRAQGDYSPDPTADRFPTLPSPTPKAAQPEAGGGVTLTDLFKLWEADHLLAGRPVRSAKDFRRCIDSLAAFVGHEVAPRITPQEVSGWVEHLRHEEGLSARTVGTKYLAAVKRVFTVGKRKFRITDNPAADVVVEVRTAVRERSPGFTDEEAKAILSAALRASEGLGGMAEGNKLAIRWGPWVCAYTGARITEVMQLRKQDVVTHEGVPCIRITPEAGSVKTGKQRLAPLHPHLVEMGFLDFVRGRPEGHLFFTLGPEDDPVTRAGHAGQKVCGWVRKTVSITDERVQPNHAWRHRFKTEARKLSIERWTVDAIQGHADGTASAGYGEVPVKPLYEAVARMPRYATS